MSGKVGDRELACLVGRNGAGQTTVLRTIRGFLRPVAGRVTLRDPAVLRIIGGTP